MDSSPRHKLEVLIVTHGPDGLQRVADMRLPSVDGVGYVVAWQHRQPATAIPAPLWRDDIAIYPNTTVGSGANRNEALAHASAPVVLMADNDLRYSRSALLAVIDTFRRYPDTDLALFRYHGAKKKYPRGVTVLKRRTIPYVTTFEMAVRLQSIRDAGVRFDPLFGAGAYYGCGEDHLFFHDCLRKGLRCVFFPVTVTSHPHSTTGSRPIATVPAARAQGAIMRRVFGMWGGLPRLPLMAWRTWRAGRAPLLWLLRHAIPAFFYPGHPAQAIL